MRWIKKNKVFLTLLMAFLNAAILFIIFLSTHLTFYKYNDFWIIGKDISRVEDKYGEFDIITNKYVAYYIYTDNKGFLPDHMEHYYYMVYDGDGIVYEVYDACQPGG